MTREIYSAGIDVGTTTTQVIISRLSIEERGMMTGIPSVKIAEKDVVYKSAIHFTPLLSHDIIDAGKLKNLVAAEYRKSGIRSTDVSTGAVIITGETARKENAQEVAEQLASFAGDFVVCTAGPDYEAVLAGWGAGAGELSKKRTGMICNFDIGGGTTNAVVFRNGHVVDAFAADIGGRLVKLDGDGMVTYVSEKLNSLIGELGLKNVAPGKRPEMGELTRLCARLAEMFIELAGTKPLSTQTQLLLIDHLPAGVRPDCVMFSGGVAEYIYGDELTGPLAVAKHGDIGPLLGNAIGRLLPQIGSRILQPDERIRATVVGAGSFSTTLSGSTITYDERCLPLKNLPVVRVPFEPKTTESYENAVSAQLRLYEETAAISVELDAEPSYEELKIIARAIATGTKDRDGPLVVVTQRDCAKALGLLLRTMLARVSPVICLDRIDADSGDYIDVGKPVDGVIPVVVKTLIFH